MINEFLLLLFPIWWIIPNRHLRQERSRSQAFALFTLLPLLGLRCEMTVRLSHPKRTKPSDEAKHCVSPWQCLYKTGVRFWPKISFCVSKHRLLMTCKNWSKGGSGQGRTVGKRTRCYSGSELKMLIWRRAIPVAGAHLTLNAVPRFSQSKDQVRKLASSMTTS